MIFHFKSFHYKIISQPFCRLCQCKTRGKKNCYGWAASLNQSQSNCSQQYLFKFSGADLWEVMYHCYKSFHVANVCHVYLCVCFSNCICFCFWVHFRVCIRFFSFFGFWSGFISEFVSVLASEFFSVKRTVSVSVFVSLFLCLSFYLCIAMLNYPARGTKGKLS